MVVVCSYYAKLIECHRVICGKMSLDLPDMDIHKSQLELGRRIEGKGMVSDGLTWLLGFIWSVIIAIFLQYFASPGGKRKKQKKREREGKGKGRERERKEGGRCKILQSCRTGLFFLHFFRGEGL